MANVSEKERISLGLAHEFFITAQKAGWTPQDVLDLSQSEELLKQLLAVKRGEVEIVAKAKPVQEGKLLIDRSKPFDPETFIGKGWKIVEQDENALKLTEIDISKIGFDPCLKEGESSVNGEEKLTHLKSKEVVRLDAKIFQKFWENQGLIPEQCKEKINGNTQYIFFDGTVLQRPGGSLYVRCLCWSDGGWHWGYGWVDRGFDVFSLSAVLAS